MKNAKKQLQHGFTIVELLVAMTISLVVVVAAAYMYLASRESQRALDRNSGSRETGTFVMQMLGREIMNAGFYPAAAAPIPTDSTQANMYDTYPPLPAEPRALTDWQNPLASWPPASFMTGIYGCDGGKFDVATSTCPTPDDKLADTVVVNYFTDESIKMSEMTGRRTDCTGADVAPELAGKGDPSNEERKKNIPTNAPSSVDKNLPPQLPLFVSNRYSLNPVKLSVDNQDIQTQSLACSGNGKSPHGVADSTAYQPIVPGLEDLQFAYGIYNSSDNIAIDRYYSATEVNALADITINGQIVKPWQRVLAVRVCVLTRTLGGNTRIADSASATSKYFDCNDAEKDQPSGDTIRKNIQVFGLRNNLRTFN